MFVGKVIGTVVATIKHRDFSGRKILIVDRLALDGAPLGDSVLAFDSVDAGPGDTVLVMDEGSSAALVTGLDNPPIRTMIVGVIDRIDVEV